MGYMQPRFKPGVEVSGFATTLIVGGTFVKVAGSFDPDGSYQLTTCGAGDAAFGVAINDSGPTTQAARSRERLVNVTRRGSIARVIAGGSITAGQAVSSDAAGKAVAQSATAATAASLATGVVGSNNAITYTAVRAGDDGNDITVQLKNPLANSQSLSVTVSDLAIVVNLATDGGGAITSTATLILAALAASSAASGLISAANTGASTGAGVVAAVAATHLAGGVDAALSTKLGIAMNTVTSGQTVEVDLH